MQLAFRRLPIRLRLTIAFAGVLTSVLAVGGLVLFTEFRGDFDKVIDENLTSRAADAAALVATGRPDAGLMRSREKLAQVYDAHGALAASTPALARARLLTVAEARRAGRGHLRVWRVDTPVGESRVQVRVAHSAAGPLAVAVAEPLDRRDHSLDRLAELLLIVGPLALMLATYAGYQVAGAALRPVERMRVGAERITERDTAERLPVPGTNDEIEALGRTLNELLARLDGAILRERRLLADASHELRTPLSVLLAEVQVALRGERDTAELRAALEAVEHEARRLSRLASDLLVLARADGGQLPVQPEPLGARKLLADAAGRAAAAAAASGRALEIDAPPELVLLADPLRAAQALDNLVANALAHGDGDVTLAAEPAGDWVELHVRDEGHGFPDGLLERAFERFSRGDPGRPGGGAGLGLPIVASIAQAHGGEAGATNLPGGGAEVWLSLPAAGARRSGLPPEAAHGDRGAGDAPRHQHDQVPRRKAAAGRVRAEGGGEGVDEVP
jgi:two-component system OmpR family sensor kinase